ncbi:MAG: GNAT family N-acetyltransferase [Beijerinckiaceae bacterium]
MPELLDLWVESWSEAMPQIDFEARRPSFIQILDELSKDGYRIVGHFNATGALAGFIALKAETGHLDHICVGASQKGSGLALELLDLARSLASGVLTLSVNQANPRAIRFYERNGFVRTGEGVNPRSGLPIYHYRWQQ